MPYELMSEEVTVCGEKLVVYQASNAMDVQRSVLISETEQPVVEDESKGTGDGYLYYMRTLLYPSLVACTVGNLPTLEEFLHKVPSTESETWSDVAKRLNPGWFRFIEDDEKKE